MQEALLEFHSPVFFSQTQNAKLEGFFLFSFFFRVVCVCVMIVCSDCGEGDGVLIAIVILKKTVSRSHSVSGIC